MKKPFKYFDFWFTFRDFDHLNVYEMRGRTQIGVINRWDKTVDTPMKTVPWEWNLLQIAQDLDSYLERPEGEIFRFTSTPEADYDEMLTCAALGRTFIDGKDPDDEYINVQKCLEWLHKTDFYKAPASTRYHDSKEGGLLNHTITVMQIIVDLAMNVKKFRGVDIYRAVFVAAMHDWCKIGYYKPYSKNVKDPMSGQWYQETAYTVNDDMLMCLGHGVSSLVMAQMFFNLNMEELSAIRWHMSHWRVCDDEVNELQYANENYPLAHALQFADQLSITKY